MKSCQDSLFKPILKIFRNITEGKGIKCFKSNSMSSPTKKKHHTQTKRTASTPCFRAIRRSLTAKNTNIPKKFTNKTENEY